MRLLAILLLSFLVLALMGVPSAGASPSPDPGQRYVLVPGAEFQEGCFDPCLCPMLLATELDGQFVLRPLDADGLWASYEISAVDWTVRFNGVFHQVAGAGILHVDAKNQQQRLLLDLRIDGEEPVQFDSGIVEQITPWPGLDVTVSRNGMFCYDQVFHVVSEPAGPVTASESSWSTLKAMFGS